MDVMRNHIKIALVETIARIFKYSLPQIKFLKIEGVIAITADTDVFIVHVDQDYDLNREKKDDADVNCIIPNRVKTEPPPSPHENGSDYINNDPSIMALLEHFQTIKKENHSNETNHSHTTEENHNSEIQTGSSQSESFFKNGSWNLEESADEESTLHRQEENFMKRVLKKRQPCKRLVKKRRSSMMSHHSNPSLPMQDPLRMSSGHGGTDNDFIITESFHVCAYQNCFKRFKLRRDLLRHQTKKHGRIPVRRRKKNVDSILNGEEEPLYIDGPSHYEFGPDDERADLIEGPI